MDINHNVLYESDWGPNLITNGGLIYMGDGSNWGTYCSLGSSTTPPTNSDTSVGGYLGTTKYFSADSSNVPPVAPNYEIWTTNKARFEAGENTGTVGVVGVGDVSNNSRLSTKHLVSPTVTKAADQILDVYYRMYRYPNLTDRTGTVMIEGVSYNYIVRGNNLNTNAAPSNFGSHYAWARLGMNTGTGNMLTTEDIVAIPNDIGISGISNPWLSTGAMTASASGSNTWLLKWYIDQGLGDIRGIKFKELGHGSSAGRGWQVRLGRTSDDAKLTKDNTEELHVVFTVTWGRHV
jgi:hypothetical protein